MEGMDAEAPLLSAPVRSERHPLRCPSVFDMPAESAGAAETGQLSRSSNTSPASDHSNFSARLRDIQRRQLRGRIN